MVKFIYLSKLTFLVIGVKYKLVQAGPGDDKSRVVQCLSGTANVGFGCGAKYRPDNKTDVYYFASCKFEDTDYENRPEVVSCAAGQQCFTTIKNFDPNGNSIIEDVYNDEKGNKYQVMAEFGCGDSNRYKGDWTEYYNKFDEGYIRERNKYFGQEAICYGDDTDGTDLWSGTDFSQKDLTCYCLDNECNRQFELPYYIQEHLTKKGRNLEDTGSVDDPVTESYQEVTEEYGSASVVTQSNSAVIDSQQTEYISDDEDLRTDDTRDQYEATTEARRTENNVYRTEEPQIETTEQYRTEQRRTEQVRTEQPRIEQTQYEQENERTEEVIEKESEQQTGNDETPTTSSGISGLSIALMVLLLIETVLIVVIYITGNIPGRRKSGAPVPENPEGQRLNNN